MMNANSVLFLRLRFPNPPPFPKIPSVLPFHPLLHYGFHQNRRFDSTVSFSGGNFCPFGYPGLFSVGGGDVWRIRGKQGNTHIVELNELLLSYGKQGISDVFFETIEESERMVREPADILEDMEDRLSSRDFQFMLVYFSQEGRDSWCALEVFDFLRKENRADKETVELMVSIMCNWMSKLIEEDCDVSQIVDLLKEMDCVGLKPEFSMVEKVISLYWDRGRKKEAMAFVKHVVEHDVLNFLSGNRKQGPIGSLVWKMMDDGDFLSAVKLVIEYREGGLMPDIYCYLIALSALVKEQNEFSKSLRKLKRFQKGGVIDYLDVKNLAYIESYQSDLLTYAELLLSWIVEENQPQFDAVVHEKLLAMHACAGRGLEAELHLWKMRLAGKEPEGELYGIVLAVCASERNTGAIQRLLAVLEAMGMSPRSRKRTLSWLLRGYIKGGHFDDASRTLILMLEHGFCLDSMDVAVVLQGLKKSLQNPGNIDLYLRICKHLSDAELVGPCLIYMYIRAHKLWIMRML